MKLYGSGENGYQVRQWRASEREREREGGGGGRERAMEMSESERNIRGSEKRHTYILWL